MKATEILISWDMFISVLVGAIVYVLTSDQVNVSFIKETTGIGITVLATLFPMFFAALAIITSFSDNEFIRFLEEQGGTYTALLSYFKLSLVTMFLVLVTSIAFYIHAVYHLANTTYSYPRIMISVYLFSFTYSMTAALLASIDSIKYLKYRTQYLGIKSKGRK